jgi:ATP-binding cassette, subfamily C (CFTR/MRP), member 1
MALATSLTSTTSGGRLGISLSQIVTFNSSLGSLLTAWTMVETSLGAIARLKGFEEGTKSEDKAEESFNPSEDWPNNGAIAFKNVSASYGSVNQHSTSISKTWQTRFPSPKKYILQNYTRLQNRHLWTYREVGSYLFLASFSVISNKHSGKSSLLSVLLRILDLESGTITIDSINLSLIPRETIRSRIITIPQEPFTLAGSVRFNADPTSTASDDLIIGALKRVKLWDVLEGRGGLDTEMMSNPLSQGQGQIFCLARAMVRVGNRKGGESGKGILVLDEATSNVDAETDRLMQRLIREEFGGYTVITVAHRLDTIRDSDWIAVLNEGRLIEWDRPGKVLGRNLGLAKEVDGESGSGQRA